MSDWLSGLFVLFVGLVIVALLASPFIYVPVYRSSAHYETFTVQEKERGSENNPYLIYTNKGVRSVEDSFSFWTFNSSDRYSELDVGKSYRCKIAGWRFPFASWYPNIIGPCTKTKNPENG